MYMYVYFYIYMYVCISILYIILYLSRFMYVCIWIYIYVKVYTYIYIRVYNLYLSILLIYISWYFHLTIYMHTLFDVYIILSCMLLFVTFLISVIYHSPCLVKVSSFFFTCIYVMYILTIAINDTYLLLPIFFSSVIVFLCKPYFYIYLLWFFISLVFLFFLVFKCV